MSARTYTEDEVLSKDTPLITIDLAGAPGSEWPFNNLMHMISVAKVVAHLYTGKREKPYRMNFYAYRWLAKCSNHNRKLLMELRTRGLIVGCDDT